MKKLLSDYIKQFGDIKEDELQVILDKIPIKAFKTGDHIMVQGEVPTKCYFVLQGCVRQYSINENGDESTFDFYTEEQSITIFNDHSKDKRSKYSAVCLEDCLLVIGDLSTEQDMYDMHPILQGLTRKMMTEDMGKMHDNFASFIASSPEERYKNLLDKRPGLIDRVPQHQLASFLGIKPESLSRIKRRLEQKHLRIVD